MAWFDKKIDKANQDAIVRYEGKDVQAMTRKELKHALLEKDIDPVGGKKKLRALLVEAIERENEERLAYLAALEAERRAEAQLEESGSVYSVGLNADGQLGQKDIESRRKFTVIRELRGKGIDQVYAGLNYVYAITEQSDVYAWGGGGLGPLAMEQDNKFDDEDAEITDEERELGPPYMRPMYVNSMRGEGIVQLAVGYNHGACVSDGGDAYTWGAGRHGQLGHAKSTEGYNDEVLPTLVEPLQELYIRSMAVGQAHSVALTDDGKVLTWGHAAKGRLGLGTEFRRGVEAPFNKFFPEPTLVPFFLALKIIVKQIDCSANHTIALAEDGVYTWGSGDGGRLGHNDNLDRHEPCLVEGLKDEIVLQVACGNWHSMALVQVPPCLYGGWVYTWGSGYAGQLGLGEQFVTTTPKLVEGLLDEVATVAYMACSSQHCAVLTDDEQMYAWGSNRHGCLGAQLPGEFYSVPQKVWAFDVMIDGVGRGPPRSIACGKEFTIVATHPYTGPTEAELIAEEEAALKAEEEAALKKAEEELQAEAEARKAELAKITGAKT